MPESLVTPRRAIVAFALGALFFAYAFIQRVSPSVMTNELMRDFAVGGAALGSLSAFYFYAYASIQLPVGMLTDRYGPRKLMSFAAALCAFKKRPSAKCIRAAPTQIPGLGKGR